MEIEPIGNNFNMADASSENNLVSKERSVLGMDTERLRLFAEVFKLLSTKIGEFVPNNSDVIDLGCGNGVVETIVDSRTRGCHISCVDTDAEVLVLMEKQKERWHRVQIQTIQSDAMNYLRSREGLSDIIISTTALHEMISPENQETNFNDFLFSVRSKINEMGIAILGDYYFPSDVDDADFVDFMERQKILYGHADNRQCFLNPELVKRKASEAGLDLLDSSDIQTIPELNRRYFLFIFGKQK